MSGRSSSSECEDESGIDTIECLRTGSDICFVSAGIRGAGESGIELEMGSQAAMGRASAWRDVVLGAGARVGGFEGPAIGELANGSEDIFSGGGSLRKGRCRRLVSEGATLRCTGNGELANGSSCTSAARATLVGSGATLDSGTVSSCVGGGDVRCGLVRSMEPTAG